MGRRDYKYEEEKFFLAGFFHKAAKEWTCQKMWAWQSWMVTDTLPTKAPLLWADGGDQKECSFSKNATKAAHNKIRAREKFCCRFCFFFSPNGRQFITVKIASKLLAGHYKRWMAKLKRHTIRRSCYHTASVRRWMVLWPWVVVRYTEEILGTINELNTHNGVPYLQ
jgi:hypothetical protein